jgi:hypothetical protein
MVEVSGSGDFETDKKPGRGGVMNQNSHRLGDAIVGEDALGEASGDERLEILK